MSETFPLIYCNGDSYCDEHYHDSLKNKVHANVIGNYYKGFVVNKSISGSCNRRIIRTTLHDLIEERRRNPAQKIVALIGLTFEMRSELWVEHVTSATPEESNFHTYQFTGKMSWREDLLNESNVSPIKNFSVDEKFFDHYNKGKAYFYSPYAERINLFTDLVMLRSILESMNIDFLIFQGPNVEKLDKTYLLDFFREELLNDNRFLDLENFGFCNWCNTNNFIPLDYRDRPDIGHYGPDAHRAFAEQVLIPKLTELKFL